MTTPTFDPNQGSPDSWNSPLWGRPDTVGGYWNEEPAAEPLLTAPAPAPAPKKTYGGMILGIAAVLVAALVGVGIVKALPTDDATSALPTPSPSTSAPATPGPSTSDPAQGSNGSGDSDNGLDPSEALPTLPAIPGLPGDDQGSSDQGSSASGTTQYQDAVDKVAPGLVNITTAVGYDGNEAAGTGVVLTSEGLVLTNHHVIAGSTSIKVAVAGTTKTYTAKVVGYDATHDIAVIQLQGASGLTVAPLGDSDSVKVGDVVIGLGNAGGKGGKPIPADGKVTGLNKSITAMNSESGTSEDLSGLIETDAAIQPGDSGGALVSREGKVVGIVTAGSVSSGRNGATEGYAVPVNQALEIAQQIRDGKASATVHIGESAFLGIQVSSSASGSTSGVRVSGTVQGSAADKLGLEAGDRITSLDGTTVTDNASLRAIIAPHHPGDTVRITWVDTSGKTRSSSITFGTGPVA
jgi:S1-C subfamily serine protease